MSIRIEYDRQQRKIPDLKGVLRDRSLDFLDGEMERAMEAVKLRFFSGRPGLQEVTGETKAGWKTVIKKRAGGGDLAGSVELFNDKLKGDPRKRQVIKAKDKLLAIPRPPALTQEGAKKFAGPRAPGVPKNMRVFRSKAGNNLIGPMKKMQLKAGRKKRWVISGAPWWVLKEKVVIPAYAAGLDTFVYTQMTIALANTSRFITKLLRGKL